MAMESILIGNLAQAFECGPIICELVKKFKEELSPLGKGEKMIVLEALTVFSMYSSINNLPIIEYAERMSTAVACFWIAISGIIAIRDVKDSVNKVIYHIQKQKEGAEGLTVKSILSATNHVVSRLLGIHVEVAFDVAVYGIFRLSSIYKLGVDDRKKLEFETKLNIQELFLTSCCVMYDQPKLSVVALKLATQEIETLRGVEIQWDDILDLDVTVHQREYENIRIRLAVCRRHAKDLPRPMVECARTLRPGEITKILSPADYEDVRSCHLPKLKIGCAEAKSKSNYPITTRVGKAETVRRGWDCYNVLSCLVNSISSIELELRQEYVYRGSVVFQRFMIAVEPSTLDPPQMIAAASLWVAAFGDLSMKEVAHGAFTVLEKSDVNTVECDVYQKVLQASQILINRLFLYNNMENIDIVFGNAIDEWEKESQKEKENRVKQETEEERRDSERRDSHKGASTSGRIG